MNSRSATLVSMVVVPALSLGCGDAATTFAPAPWTPSASISDAAHFGGTPHFYFLPPLVGDAGSTEALDTSVASFIAVEICEWTGSTCATPPLARFTASTGPSSETVRIETDHYIANWRTDQFDLSADKLYRIRVGVAGTELGHADVDVVESGKELKSVDTGEYIGLLDGRTLPIKFKIEEGAVFVVGAVGGTIHVLSDTVRLEIPAGALGSPVGVLVRPATEFPADSGFVRGAAYEIHPAGTALAVPASLALTYDGGSVPDGTAESALRLHRVVDGAWVEIFDSDADTAATRTAGAISAFGTFGVLRKRPVDRVIVEPDSLQIPVGDSAFLRATPRDSRGHPLRRRIEWASSHPAIAAVDLEGRVTAISSGPATVTARSEDRVGSATLIVVDPAYPHEPPGFTKITERSFDALGENGWRSAMSEHFAIVQDATAPKSAPNVGQARFPAGFPGGEGPMWTEFGDFAHLGYRKLYLSFWIKVSENWQGHHSAFNKIGFVWMHHSALLFPTIKGAGSDPLRSRIGLQGIPVVQARNLDPNLTQVEIVRGRWHRWEILLIPNTGDNANGEVHWWIDGVKVGEHTDVTVKDATQSDAIQYVTWFPIWGGLDNAVAETMYMWMDHFYASGAR